MTCTKALDIVLWQFRDDVKEMLGSILFDVTLGSKDATKDTARCMSFLSEGSVRVVSG